MRKIFLLFILLLSITFVRAQILIDNGPLKDPNAIFLFMNYLNLSGIKRI